MTQYELIKANESLLRIMVGNGILAKDVWMLEMVDEADEMKAAGEKQQYITATLAEKYQISPRSVYNTLARLKESVTI